MFLNAFYMLPNVFPQCGLNVFFSNCFRKTTWYNFGTHVAAAKNKRPATVSVPTLPLQKQAPRYSFGTHVAAAKNRRSATVSVPTLPLQKTNIKTI